MNSVFGPALGPLNIGGYIDSALVEILVVYPPND